jgi:hypothetical protein
MSTARLARSRSSASKVIKPRFGPQKAAEVAGQPELLPVQDVPSYRGTDAVRVILMK